MLGPDIRLQHRQLFVCKLITPPSWHSRVLITSITTTISRYIIRVPCTLMCNVIMCQEHMRDIGDVSQVVRVCQLFNEGFEGMSLTLGHKNIGPQRVPVPQAILATHTRRRSTLTQRQGISLLSALYLLSDPTQSIQANLQTTNHEINSTNFLPVCFKKIEWTKCKVMQLFFHLF